MFEGDTKRKGEKLNMSRMVGDVGFIEDIRALFTDSDVTCMRGLVLDLADWSSVRAKADGIKDEVESGNMPMGNPWPAERVALFRHWVDEGCPKRRATHYVSYSDSIDRETEYENSPRSGLMDSERRPRQHR